MDHKHIGDVPMKTPPILRGLPKKPVIFLARNLPSSAAVTYSCRPTLGENGKPRVYCHIHCFAGFLCGISDIHMIHVQICVCVYVYIYICIVYTQVFHLINTRDIPAIYP